MKLALVGTGEPAQVPGEAIAVAVELKMSLPEIEGSTVLLGVAETKRVLAEDLVLEPTEFVAV